ncbi:MAG: hypothetical protein LJE75_13555, partial [Gammaproteobacteria bacterium]|nr:hypothetical protein [Gammaproteobacteria bacterium]
PSMTDNGLANPVIGQEDVILSHLVGCRRFLWGISDVSRFLYYSCEPPTLWQESSLVRMVLSVDMGCREGRAVFPYCLES